MLTIRVFSVDSESPLVARNCSTHGFTSFSRTSGVAGDHEVIRIPHNIHFQLLSVGYSQLGPRDRPVVVPARSAPRWPRSGK
jgi:hypothetical protein